MCGEALELTAPRAQGKFTAKTCTSGRRRCAFCSQTSLLLPNPSWCGVTGSRHEQVLWLEKGVLKRVTKPFDAPAVPSCDSRATKKICTFYFQEEKLKPGEKSPGGKLNSFKAFCNAFPWCVGRKISLPSKPGSSLHSPSGLRGSLQTSGAF